MLGPKVSIDVLKLAVASATTIREQLLLADEIGDREGLSEGAALLGSLLHDATEIVLQSGAPVGLAAAQGRLPSQEWGPEELVESLRLAVQIEEIAIDILLRDRPDLTDEENAALLNEARLLTQALGARARSTRALIQERWPYSWTESLEAEFRKILEIRRKFKK